MTRILVDGCALDSGYSEDNPDKALAALNRGLRVKGVDVDDLSIKVYWEDPNCVEIATEDAEIAERLLPLLREMVGKPSGCYRSSYGITGVFVIGAGDAQ